MSIAQKERGSESLPAKKVDDPLLAYYSRQRHVVPGSPVKSCVHTVSGGYAFLFFFLLAYNRLDTELSRYHHRLNCSPDQMISQLVGEEIY